MMKKETKEKEVWRYVPNTANLYQVSNFGRIKRLDSKTKEWVESKSFQNGRGGLDVGINFLDKNKACAVSRLVAEAFIENDDTETKKYVLHIDGNRKNNHFTNLRWATNKEVFSRTHWQRQEARQKTLELMHEKSVEKAKELESNTGWAKRQKELIAKLDPNVETWEFLPGYQDKYAVSSFGRVKSYSGKGDKQGILRKLGADKKTGALKLELCVDNKKSKQMVHRLVAEVFVENNDPVNKTMVIHIDGNKENNHAENLKWIGKEEWQEYNKRRFRLVGEENVAIKRGNTHLNMESARLIRRLAEQGVSTAKLAKLFCVTTMQILRIKKNESWKEEVES
jgi:hypothetical protein